MKMNDYEFPNMRPTAFHRCEEAHPEGFATDARIKVPGCPGYPTCFRVFFSIEDLGHQLFRQSIKFVNAKINRPRQVLDFFNGAYAPSSIPKLKEVREAQRDLKAWLARETSDTSQVELSFAEDGEPNEITFTCPEDVFPEDEDIGFAPPSFDKDDSYVGLADMSPPQTHIVAEPFTSAFLRFVGKEVVEEHRRIIAVPKSVDKRFRINFYYRVVNASLHDLTVLARVFILQYGKRGRTHLCAREGCGKIFIDEKSRGTPRKYCLTEDCDKALAAERVAKSRAKARAAQKKVTKKRRSKK